MPRYPSSWLEELRARSDIVQVVSGYVPLKKSGRHHWGLCPFHGEKTASFSVDEERQLFYCFGCKAGGDVFHFVSEIERCSFSEAVQLLAERAHMDIPEMEESEEYRRLRSQRERLLLANKTAARFYHELLYQPAGAASLAYLRRRGLTDSVIRRFGLGASPDEWSALTDYLQNQGFSLEELRLAGLTVVKEAESSDGKPGKRRAFDMFRSRAMFPIIDQYGNVLAFGGRALGDQQPKYLNTSDTPVFNKRKGVYAANLLKKERQLTRVLLVEGYMDVVALTQAGIRGAAATLGTSLTPEQAKLLSRFAPEVHICYDGDEPGQHAIEKALGIFEQEQIPVKAVYLPDGLDPDELIRQRGLDAFEALTPMAPVRFRLMRLEKVSEFDTDEGRVKYVKEACALLAPVADPVEIEVYVRQISRKSGFDREIILAQLHSRPGQASPPVKTGSTAAKRPVRSKETPADESEKTLIRIMASGTLPDNLVKADDFLDPELKALAGQLIEKRSPAQIISEATDDKRSVIAELLSGDDYANDSDRLKAATDCLKNMREKRLQSQLDTLKEQLSGADDEERRNLLRRMMELQAAMKH